MYACGGGGGINSGGTAGVGGCLNGGNGTNSAATGTAGTANTGSGGGGGGGVNNTSAGSGGAGGSGVVIILVPYANGGIGINNVTPQAYLDINANSFILEASSTPPFSTSTCATGQIGWDANYLYICTATDNWRKATTTSF
jgi:hypothetical protein